MYPRIKKLKSAEEYKMKTKSLSASHSVAHHSLSLIFPDIFHALKSIYK